MLESTPDKKLLKLFLYLKEKHIGQIKEFMKHKAQIVISIDLENHLAKHITLSNYKKNSITQKKIK